MSYRDTVSLPKTDFPMRAGLATREPELLARWSQENLYERIIESRQGRPRYLLHDGPPFANGKVHMGTALNKVLKDFVIKSKTMAGFQAPFVPGWDCHGLPIEFKVVQSSRGLTPLQIREQSEAYARKFITIQRDDFKRLGVFGDWENPYLTLDPAYEASVIRSFGKIVKKGLVYRSKKPVHWSTGAQTALAEAEIEYQEKISPAIYVAFPLKNENLENVSVIIWTTTPWTLPANVAVALNADATYVILHTKNKKGSERKYLVAEKLVDKICEACALEKISLHETFLGSQLAGMQVEHPFLPRTATLFCGDFVTLDTGTGLVHIAPGHGEDDYSLGIKNNLPILSPVDDDGCFTEECGLTELVGKQVFAGNQLIIDLLEARGLLLGHKEYTHSYPHCWRSKTPILFRAVEQFFISISKLRESALSAIDEVSWLPHWGRNRIRGTVENRPDWCISRQRSWGVPLPVFYDEKNQPILDPLIIANVAKVIEEHGSNAWFSLDDPTWCRLAGAPVGSTRRFDTLDVWIDSGVSHEAVLRARPELQFPADLYLEATDQHRGWFQSSLMTSIALHGVAPYKSVLTHGYVVDVDTRQKISKSNQGTPGYQKPTEVDHFIKTYGADIVRLWASSIQITDDVPFSEEIFARVTDSYRRLRNTLRILLGNLAGYDPHASTPTPTGIDLWILGRLQQVVNICRSAYDEFSFQRVFHTINQFCTVDLSSHYIDATKDRLYCDSPNSNRRRSTQATMAHIFETLTRLLAPILVFTAEEAWGYYRPGSSIHVEYFPEVVEVDEELLKRYEKLFLLRGQVAQALEKAQNDHLISNPLEAKVIVTTEDTLILQSTGTSAGLSEAEELFILSYLEVVQGPEMIRIEKTTTQKCERCWRHRNDVGNHHEHPTLCGRCSTVMSERI
jgi:isoleucyl-tRNA synthetase